MAFYCTITWTLFFFFLYPKLDGVVSNKVVAPILIGIFVWIVMNLVVLPLSNVPQISFSAESVLINITILILAVGVPISYLMTKYYQPMAKGIEE